MASRATANRLQGNTSAGSSPASSAKIMTEKDARRGRRWVKKARKKGYRVENVGDETNKDILKRGIFKQTCYPPDYSIKDID